MSACGAAEETESKVTEPFEGLSCLADFIRCDNGPENVSGAVQPWASKHGIWMEYI